MRSEFSFEFASSFTFLKEKQKSPALQSGSGERGRSIYSYGKLIILYQIIQRQDRIEGEGNFEVCHLF